MTVSPRAIALTGTIGAGKTTLAEAISEELHEQGIGHALLDLDWLGQVYPVPEGHDPYGYELALHNLKEIWPNFKGVGADRAIIAGTLLNRDQREGLRDGLGGVPLAVVLVKAPQEMLQARIRSRNSGRLLEDFLARTADVAREIEAAGIDDFAVENGGRTPREVARQILRKVDWIASK